MGLGQRGYVAFVSISDYLIRTSRNLWLWSLTLKKPIYAVHNESCICEQKRFGLELGRLIVLAFSLILFGLLAL